MFSAAWPGAGRWDGCVWSNLFSSLASLPASPLRQPSRPSILLGLPVLVILTLRELGPVVGTGCQQTGCSGGPLFRSLNHIHSPAPLPVSNAPGLCTRSRVSRSGTPSIIRAHGWHHQFPLPRPLQTLGIDRARSWLIGSWVGRCPGAGTAVGGLSPHALQAAGVGQKR